MDTLRNEFFEAWEKEIAAYQETVLILSEQKYALMKWNIKNFQSISQQAALLISKAHKATNQRTDIMETLLIMMGKDLKENNLKNIHLCFEDEFSEKSKVFFKVFANTLKTIDKLSMENKELIRTGLELVGDNLEMISDIIEEDRVYSRVGMINQKRSSLILNRRI